MKLTGKQLKQLHKALLDAFALDELELMVSTELEENLDAIAGGGNRSQIIFNLIQWAERRGRTEDLIQGAVNFDPDNAALVVVCNALLGTPAADEPSQPPSIEPSPTKPMSRPDIAINYPDELLNAIGRGSLVPFVGAGMSMGAGLPGWYDLISDLAQRSGQEMPPAQWAAGDTLMGIAQTYVNQNNLGSLIRILKDRLDTTNKPPTDAHRALAQLPVNLVFTANYDDLLERAFRDAGKRVEVIVRDNNIPFMELGQDRVNIVKLYGDLNQPETVVLAQAQYERFFQDRPEMVKLLDVELGRSTLLYLGWSHTDPYFKLIIGQMLSRYQAMMRAGYAALFDVPAAQAAELQRKHIHIVDLPPGPSKTAQLATWLDGLQTGPQTTTSSQP